MRILYVEDNQANVFLVKRVAKNHTVINYIDGEEALRNFVRDDPDIVLMDIQLAGRLNGLEVIQKLRSDGHKVPIIAVTAYAMVGDRERCLAAGCDEYIAKPLPIPTLVELFQKFDVQAKNRQATPEATTATSEDSKVKMPEQSAKLEVVPSAPTSDKDGVQPTPETIIPTEVSRSMINTTPSEPVVEVASVEKSAEKQESAPIKTETPAVVTSEQTVSEKETVHEVSDNKEATPSDKDTAEERNATA